MRTLEATPTRSGCSSGPSTQPLLKRRDERGQRRRELDRVRLVARRARRLVSVDHDAAGPVERGGLAVACGDRVSRPYPGRELGGALVELAVQLRGAAVVPARGVSVARVGACRTRVTCVCAWLRVGVVV